MEQGKIDCYLSPLDQCKDTDEIYPHSKEMFASHQSLSKVFWCTMSLNKMVQVKLWKTSLKSLITSLVFRQSKASRIKFRPLLLKLARLNQPWLNFFNDWKVGKTFLEVGNFFFFISQPSCQVGQPIDLFSNSAAYAFPSST